MFDDRDTNPSDPIVRVSSIPAKPPDLCHTTPVIFCEGRKTKLEYPENAAARTIIETIKAHFNSITLDPVLFSPFCNRD
jgi:hypothetical protein